MNISGISSGTYSNFGYSSTVNRRIAGDLEQSVHPGGMSEIQPQVNKPAAVSPSKNPEQNSSSSESSNYREQAQNAQTEVVNGYTLTQDELRLVEQLKQIDAEVRRHEMAHVAAGGQYISSGANFSYKKGPDGKNYAVAGEVSIDVSPIPGDPEATIQKMRKVRSAALAPANPSAQDRKVASNASAQTSKAMAELMIQTAKQQAETNKKAAFGSNAQAAESYIKVNKLPETETSTFQIAV